MLNAVGTAWDVGVWESRGKPPFIFIYHSFTVRKE